jgi:nucleoside 2-deoxyribosyltransferase
MSIRVYTAGPLFTEDELAGCERLAERIAQLPWTPLIGVHPHRFCADLFTPGATTNFSQVRQRCLDELTTCGLVLANLNGPDIDSGTAYEVGVAWARNIPVIGYRSDIRPAENGAGNCMITAGLRALVTGPNAQARALEQALAIATSWPSVRPTQVVSVPAPSVADLAHLREGLHLAKRVYGECHQGVLTGAEGHAHAVRAVVSAVRSLLMDVRNVGPCTPLHRDYQLILRAGERGGLGGSLARNTLDTLCAQIDDDLTTTALALWPYDGEAAIDCHRGLTMVMHGIRTILCQPLLLTPQPTWLTTLTGRCLLYTSPSPRDH